MANKTSIRCKMAISYEGRSEMVNSKNETTSMRIKLSAGSLNNCCDSIPSSSNGVKDNENSDWSNSPYAEGTLELRVDNSDAFKFFKDYAEFEITLVGAKDKKD